MTDHILPQVAIEARIHEIRGKKVMLDRDLAALYEVETRVLNQAVQRNIKRFPDDFMFQLSSDEFDNLKSQLVTSSWGGVRKMPYVFTDYGVAMLSGILHSERAIEINIQIMRAFTRLRSLVADNADIRKAIRNIEQRLGAHDQQIQVAFAALKSLMQSKPSAPEQIIPQVLPPKKKMGFGKEEKKDTLVRKKTLTRR